MKRPPDHDKNEIANIALWLRIGRIAGLMVFAAVIGAGLVVVFRL